MKLFPALFYIACILLLGIRLRPLHSSTSIPFTTILGWQRELKLWLGWTYKLFTTISTWLRETPAPLLTTTDPAYPQLPLWKVDGHVKVAVTRYLNVRVLYTPIVVILDFWKNSVVGVESGNQIKEMVGNLLEMCWTASNPLLDPPGPGSVPLMVELEELGGLVGEIRSSGWPIKNVLTIA